MSSQSVPSVQKQKPALQLLLVIGIVLYVYSPMLDHWLGHDYYARPHTHIDLPGNLSTGIFAQNQIEIDDHHPEHSEPEDYVLCLLDINTLLYAPLDDNVVLIVQNVPLIFDIFPYLVTGSTVYLPSLDPPPRIYA